MKPPLSAIAIATLLTITAVQLGAQISDRALALHGDALVFDAHVHIINRQLIQGGSIGDRYPDGHVDLPRMEEGGIDALFFTVYTTEKYFPGRFETKLGLRVIDRALSEIEAHSNRIEVALSASDLDRITASGKIAAVLDLEGSIDLDGDLGVLRMFHRLGLRVLQLPAHNWGNEYADSCCAPPKWGGLNEHGRAFIREMNRLGMVINISHASDETIEQALEVSEDPLIATHHGLRSLNDIPRLMPDHLLRKLAAKGGLFGIHIGHTFHKRAFYDWKTERAGRSFFDTSNVEDSAEGLTMYEIDESTKSRFPAVGPTPPPELLMSVDDWLEVVERAIEIAGEDHIILGTDFDGSPAPPDGVNDISDLPLLTDGMLRRGWSEERIRKFMGGNLLRVFREINP
ncbi:MAG: membrane dipeptidase [Verrucomicrobia bacterium]|nr:membrane dipeptidase [Verrucomicrobiota bacterium]